MPAPAQPMEDETPWKTGDDNDVKPVQFDYSELEPTGAADSIQQQQVLFFYFDPHAEGTYGVQLSFNKATKEERAILEEKYPIGNHPDIDPNKRIYHDKKTGFYYDLNSTRMGVWSSAMVRRAGSEED
ncbi:hypothetical protein B0H14DRAFT_2624500 [Mycena olivaceomarginata]|nr:hypothetical protein B0H14DRAFT_2624500 [Mycena olivaceomarginata]